VGTLTGLQWMIYVSVRIIFTLAKLTFLCRIRTRSLWAFPQPVEVLLQPKRSDGEGSRMKIVIIEEVIDVVLPRDRLPFSAFVEERPGACQNIG
jgi:hypothetical protein